VWEAAAALMRELGKVPVRVKKDIPGFLANRLQHAMMREAFALIDAGLASPEDVDAAVRYGFGLRYLAAGPVLQKDIAGLDIHCAAAATMYPNLANNTAPGAALSGLVAAGKLGMKTGRLLQVDPGVGRARARALRARAARGAGDTQGRALAPVVLSAAKDLILRFQRMRFFGLRPQNDRLTRLRAPACRIPLRPARRRASAAARG